MGLRDLLERGGFIKESNSEPVQPVTAAVQPAAVITFPSSMPSTGGVATQDYNAYLDQQLEEANLPGLDFYEFNKTLKSYEGKPIGEAQKFEFAYAPFEASGVTPQKLVEASSHYTNKLDVVERDFNAQAAEETQNNVTAKEGKIESLRQENERLTLQIQANNEEAQRLAQEVFTSTNSIAAEKQAFEFALSNMRSLIADRVQKIQTYLYARATK